MKKFIIPLLFLLTVGCSQPQQNDVNIDVTPSNVQGFNVSNFAQLLKTTKDPQSLEQALNAPNNSINNLDLNNDGKVDYVKVVEQQNGTLQVVDDYSSTQSAVVATMNINQQSNTLSINGNQTYCGNDYSYQSHFSVGDYLMMSYLLAPHHYYTPLYHYGYYPSSYHQTTIVRRSYSPSGRSSQSRSVNSAPSRSSLSSPTTSQRSFESRNSSAPVRSGGFGSSHTSSSSGSSFGGSSRSSFGGSRSSFGGGGGRRR